MKIMLFAIPVFFILIGLELLVQKLQRSKLYDFGDAITNINCGITSQVVGIFLKVLTFTLYYLIYEHLRFMTVPDTWWSWILLFIGIDFFYYWFHRYAHEIALLWGTHIVHHQSEEYNLSVALRQSAFQGAFGAFFYYPLAFMGFSPEAFVTLNVLQTLYQFWIHTRAIDKMPAWFEYVFNTPSHHRVHHGINPEYIDKNHGGTLIIFDRMFGTFEPERAEVVYGVTKPLSSWNVVWANWDFYADLLREMRQTKGFGDKLRLLFHGPGWRPDYLGGPMAVKPIKPEEQHKYHSDISAPLQVYLFLQFVLLLGASSQFLAFSGTKDLSDSQQLQEVLVWAIQIVLGVTAIGALLEQRPWALGFETVRLFLPALCWYVLYGGQVWPLLAFVWAVFSLMGLIFTVQIYPSSHPSSRPPVSDSGPRGGVG
jgi:sterol desaturase/sphingolipid hydroxylase (fatty acid hydroxylase superfamily)